MQEKSLYQRIHLNIIDGRLPEKFSLGDEKRGKNEIHFVDGALDGIHIFHMIEKKPDMEPVIAILGKIGEGKEEEAKDALYHYYEETSSVTLDLIDSLQEYIIQHQDELEAQKIYQFAIRMVMEGTQNEVVKFGLSLLELFPTDSYEQIKQIIRELALSDEFTIFCLFIMGQWKNGNDEIFQIAKRVKGWGRIHAVERLNPETEEIFSWILKEGCQNDILPEYSALTCVEKLNLQEWIKGQLTEEEYRDVGFIVNALYPEGPAPGISGLENAPEFLNSYLEHTKIYAREWMDYERVLKIFKNFREEDEYEEIIEKCEKILHSPGSVMAVQRGIEEGKALDLAEYLELPFEEKIYALLSENILKNLHYLDYLMKQETYAKRLIKLYEEKLPLEKLGQGASDILGFGKEYEEDRALAYIVQHLKSYRNEGMKLLKTALRSPVIGTRNTALNVIEAWLDERGVSLPEYSGELYEYLQECLLEEVDDKTKERMRICLENPMFL